LDLSPRKQASRINEVGGLIKQKRSLRDRATLPFLESVVQDLRFTLRTASEEPGLLPLLPLDGSARIGAVWQSLLSSTPRSSNHCPIGTSRLLFVTETR